MLTPVERYGNIWLKRDDLWKGEAPARGGKARTAGLICRHLIENNIAGAVCCLDRSSSVPGMLSRVFSYYGRTLNIFMPKAKSPLPKPFAEAQTCKGVKLHEVSTGYMTVRVARAKELCAAKGLALLGVGLYLEDGRGVPLGMEDTAQQVKNIPQDVRRIVVPVGSGGTLRGVAVGVERYFDGGVPVIGVSVGQIYKLGRYPSFVALVPSGHNFGKEKPAKVGDIDLDPVYEAHCTPFLEDGDLLWIVAHRNTE